MESFEDGPDIESGQMDLAVDRRVQRRCRQGRCDSRLQPGGRQRKRPRRVVRVEARLVPNEEKARLDNPPFPPLTRRGNDWESTVVLAAWSGYSARSSPEGPRHRISDGTFDLLIMAARTATTPGAVPTSAQAAAFEFLFKNQHEI
jgi:hypothetical protein